MLVRIQPDLPPEQSLQHYSMKNSPFTIEGSDFKGVWNVFNGMCHIAGPYKTEAEARKVKREMDGAVLRHDAIQSKKEEIRVLRECIKEGGHSEDLESWRHELSLALEQLDRLNAHEA